MFVSKEEAKKIIDEAPGKIWVDAFSNVTFIHTKSKEISVDEGKNMINNALSVDYQDNVFFGRLSLEGVQERMIHNINFPVFLE